MTIASMGTVDTTLRVLIVDDEEPLRVLFRRHLEQHGCEVVAEAAGVDGLVELAAEHEPDVVLLDLRLGPDHGADAIGPLTRALPRTMLAVLTSLDAEDAEDASRRAGAFAYYEKTMLADLTRFLLEDIVTFRRALAGEDVLAPSAIARR